MKKLLLFFLCIAFSLGTEPFAFSEIPSPEAIGASSINLMWDTVNFPVDFSVYCPVRPGLVYAISEQQGFLVSTDDGQHWESRNHGLPMKSVYPYQEKKIRLLTAMGFDPINPERVAVATSHALYLSEDQGRTWCFKPLMPPMTRATYITAVALAPGDPQTLFLGTSFEGIFVSRDGGEYWHELSKGLGFMYQGAGFREEVSALACHPELTGTLLFSCGFGEDVYQYDYHKNTIKKIEMPFKKGTVVRFLSFYSLETDPSGGKASGKLWRLGIETDNQLWSYNEAANDEWRIIAERQAMPEDLIRSERLKKAANRRGIYLRSDYATGKKLDETIAFMKKMNLDTVIIDFKDDSGNLTYNTQLAMPKQLRAVHKRFDVETLLKKTKANGIYVVARLVVFKDQRLYNYKDYKYAVWDNVSNGPWRNLLKREDPVTHQVSYRQGEYWVDCFAQDVWQYNIAIAEELQTLGVDEIQFDYIRFPTDGNLKRTYYRYRDSGMERTDALESFLAMARERLRIPISTDLYGFNCWSRIDGWNGQNIEIFSRYIDVICPMFYPSHFPSTFMKDVEYLERAKRIYRDGTQRAGIMVEQRSLIRPYVQAFLMGGERKMTEPSYTRYLTNQLEGAEAGGASGFTLWNMSGRYYMLANPLPPKREVISNEPQTRMEFGKKGRSDGR